MGIKKKVVETKEKVKSWCKEHVDDIVVFGGGAVLVVTGYLMGHMTGHSEGVLDGRKVGLRDMLEAFGIDPEGDDTTVCIRNADTGYIDAICTSEFNHLLEINDTIIHYDDGSFEFGSEVKQKQ